MSLRGDIPQSKKIATYLSGIFVDGNVYNSVIVAAFLKNGFVDGQVPVLPHLPGIDSKRKRETSKVSIECAAIDMFYITTVPSAVTTP